MTYKFKGKLYEEERDVCGDCCEDCSTCSRREESAAIQSALDFVKYRKNKIDMDEFDGA